MSKPIELTRDLAERILEKLVEGQMTIENEFGKCRDKDEVITSADMPNEYYELDVLIQASL